VTCTSTCIQPSPSNAHCGACHTTFGAVSGFDRHRRGGECYGPALTTMHRDRNGIWRMDGRDPRADAHSADAVEPQSDETPSVVPECGSGDPDASESAYLCPDHPGPLDDARNHVCRLRPGGSA
jgi:hypothetical protein